MPGKLIPDHLVARLVDEGKTDGEIRDYLAERENLQVTRQAITNWRRRRGDEPRQLAVPRAIPWKVAKEHATLQPARVIRWYARRQAGLPLAEPEARALDRAMRDLAQVDGVLTYVPGTAEGWFVVKRRPGVDEGIIREPDPSELP